VKKCLML